MTVKTSTVGRHVRLDDIPRHLRKLVAKAAWQARIDGVIHVDTYMKLRRNGLDPWAILARYAR